MSDNWRSRGEDHRLMPRRAEQLAPPQLTPHSLAKPEVTLSPAIRSARALKRSADMLEALHQIDVATSPQAVAEIAAWLDEVYAARRGGDLVGVLGHCYLGHPYIDHALSMSGEHILEHYTPGDAVPSIYQSARSLAVSDAYAYIEIYADGQIIPVRPDGTPAA
jgi:hypothetical protein